MKKETLQNFGYFYHLTPLILDEKQEELDYPFYELVFSDGMIYHFYVGNNSNDFIITSYKSVNNKIRTIKNMDVFSIFFSFNTIYRFILIYTW